MNRGIRQFYLSCTSRPIIENSSEIEFAEYPAIIGQIVGTSNLEEEDWLVKELVEDFNWLQREHSPNWRALNEKIDDDTWIKVRELLDSKSPMADTVLELVMER